MSTSTFLGSLPCWTTPVTTSPSRPAYSPKVISSSASRSRWRMTCLAVVAAIRPKPEGVSSKSRGSAPSSRSVRVLLRPHRHMPGVAVQLHPRPPAAALGAVVGDEEGRLDRLDQQVERDLLLPHQSPQGTHVDIHGYASSLFSSIFSSRSSRLVGLAVELQLDTRLGDLVEGEPAGGRLAALDARHLEVQALVVDRDDPGHQLARPRGVGP